MDLWDRNSPRYFVVDRAAAYVADASHRVKVEKLALSDLGPYPPRMDGLHFDRFVEWLTRRYDRPTVSDELYNAFQGPIYTALNELDGKDAEAARLMGLATHDIRISATSATIPPCTVGVVYLTNPAITKEQLDAIQRIHNIFTEVVSNEVVIPDPEFFDIYEVPYGVILRTQPLILDYLSNSNPEHALPVWLLAKDTN